MIKGVGFRPDFVWVKNRDQADGHRLQDSVRGALNSLQTNDNNAEWEELNSLQSFDEDGFTVGADGQWNTNAEKYVAWCWKAGVATENNEGSIPSIVSANPETGFSIVKYTGIGVNATVGHGLGIKPSLVIFKNLDVARAWPVYSEALGATKVLYLNVINAMLTSSNKWNDTEPDTDVITIGSSAHHNESAQDIIAYCFAEVPGLSKFGSYTGNGSTVGPYVECGFKPDYLMIKRTDSTGDWLIYDSKRSPDNPRNEMLYVNLSDTEQVDNTLHNVNFMDTGFALNGSHIQGNGSGGNYIYMAFKSGEVTTTESEFTQTSDEIILPASTRQLGTGVDLKADESTKDTIIYTWKEE